jgi:hypothetical protein
MQVLEKKMGKQRKDEEMVLIGMKNFSNMTRSLDRYLRKTAADRGIG